jgi:uncharacterized protein YcfL
MKQVFLVVFIFLTIIGCSSKQFWYNNNYPSNNQQYYFNIDCAECRAIASQYYPAQQIYINQKGSQNTHGYFNTYGNDGYSQYGYYNQNTYNSNPMAQWADMTNMANAANAQLRQNQLFKACLMKKGWYILDSKSKK